MNRSHKNTRTRLPILLALAVIREERSMGLSIWEETDEGARTITRQNNFLREGVSYGSMIGGCEHIGQCRGSKRTGLLCTREALLEPNSYRR